MSDTFDHEGDAWDSYERESNHGDGWCRSLYWEPPAKAPMVRGRRADLVCRICGAGGLRWLDKLFSWGLQSPDGAEHVCPQNIPTTEGFDDVD